MLPIQGSVYMLVADGTNITVSVGQDGVVVVNTGTAAHVGQDPPVINQLVKAAVCLRRRTPARESTARARGAGPART